ncbi:hypothetical protein HOY82DRAFT_672429 [Tuber indicum]|nr:hypothetical protein HOY82DRAFT_672429 [Tuber indicum]
MVKKKRAVTSGSPEGDLSAPHPEVPPIEPKTRDKPGAKRRRCGARREARKRHESSEEKRQEDITAPTATNGKPKPRSKVQDEEERVSTKLTVEGLDTHAEEAKPKETKVGTIDQATQTVRTRRKRKETKDAATQTEAQKPEEMPKGRKRKRGEYSSSSSSSSSSESDESSSTSGYSDDETSSWGSCDEWGGWEQGNNWYEDLWWDVYGRPDDWAWGISDEDDY